MLVLHTLYHHTSGAWRTGCASARASSSPPGHPRRHRGGGCGGSADPGGDRTTLEGLDEKGSNTRKFYSGPEYQNLDVYQVNCTYYSALERNDDSYLAARTIQFFTPGIPQVYYVGLLAGENDIELVEQATRNGRDINPPQLQPWTRKHLPP
jgi:sucrose phosphorylase